MTKTTDESLHVLSLIQSMPRYGGWCPTCEQLSLGWETVEDCGRTYLFCDDCQDEEAKRNREYHVLISWSDIMDGKVWYRLGQNNTTWKSLKKRLPVLCQIIVDLEELADSIDYVLTRMRKLCGAT